MLTSTPSSPPLSYLPLPSFLSAPLAAASVILGRRRFGSQGWSCAYGFNLGDLTICANVLQNYLNHAGSSAVPWQVWV